MNFSYLTVFVNPQFLSTDERRSYSIANCICFDTLLRGVP